MNATRFSQKSRSLFLRIGLMALLLAILLGGCFPSAGETGQQATVEALAKRVALTATAAADTGEETGNAEPVQSTMVVVATAAAEEQVATQTQVSVQDLQAQQATADAARPVLAEVPFFDVDPDIGRVGWVHPGFTLEAVGPEGVAARNDFAGVVAGDFVLSADITWNTQYGDSGCGFVVRSDGNPNVPSQYMFAMTRFANGHVGFLVISKGELVNGADLYPRSKDRKFSADNDSTNQLTIVGRGTRFKIYTNGVLIGEVDPNVPPPIPEVPQPPDSSEATTPEQQATLAVLQSAEGQVKQEIMARYAERKELFNESNKDFPKGFTSMVAITQAGKVTCTFNNAWLFLIEE